MRASAVFWCFVLLCTAVKVTDAEKITEDSDGGALVIDDYRESSKHGVYDENDEIDERQQDAAPEGRQFTLPSIRAESVLAALRGAFDGIKPTVYVLSVMLGMFLSFVLKESPLSPLPVPPLPNSPVGPYPPTNMYPLGIPPVRRQKPTYNAYNNINFAQHPYYRRGRILLEDMESSRSREVLSNVLVRIFEEVYDKYKVIVHGGNESIKNEARKNQNLTNKGTPIESRNRSRDKDVDT